MLLKFLSASESVRKFNRRNLLIIVLIVLAIQVIDLTIGTLADIFQSFAVSLWGLMLFIFLATAAWIGQFLILDMIKEKNKVQQVKRTNINMIEKVVTAVQYILAAFIVLLFLQMIFISRYNTAILNIGTIISVGLAIYLMGQFSYWFLSWFRRNRSFILLLFGIAMAIVSINLIAMVVLFNIEWTRMPSTITPKSEVVFKVGPEIEELVNTVQTDAGVASFILVWSGTVLLLRHNIHRIGKVKFWILLSTPIIIYSASYLSLYQSLVGTIQTNNELISLVVPVLLITYSGIASSALIGVAIRSIAKPLSDSSIKDYMIVTSYGFILFFTAILASAPIGYPPFGFVNVLLIGPFSFLILNGLYRSAISIAEDVNLRRSIKNTTKKELKLLDDIGTAEMYKDIERRVTRLTKANADQLTEQSGIEPSLTDEEVRNYLAFVTEEIKKQ